MHRFTSHLLFLRISESAVASGTIRKGVIFAHMWSCGLRNIFIWPFTFLPRDCLKLSLTLVRVRNRASSVSFSLRLCAGNNDTQDATSFLTRVTRPLWGGGLVTLGCFDTREANDKSRLPCGEWRVQVRLLTSACGPVRLAGLVSRLAPDSMASGGCGEWRVASH